MTFARLVVEMVTSSAVMAAPALSTRTVTIPLLIPMMIPNGTAMIAPLSAIRARSACTVVRLAI